MKQKEVFVVCYYSRDTHSRPSLAVYYSYHSAIEEVTQYIRESEEEFKNEGDEKKYIFSMVDYYSLEMLWQTEDKSDFVLLTVDYPSEKED